MTVRIEQSEGDIYPRITIDGVDIGRFVTGIDLRSSAGEMTTAEVRLMPATMCVDLPDEAARLVHDDA